MSANHVIDPVCGMTINADWAPHQREHSGAVWYLCSMECCLKFDADAVAYITAARLDLPEWGRTPHPESVIEQFRRPES